MRPDPVMKGRKPFIEDKILIKFFLSKEDIIVSSRIFMVPKSDPIWKVIAEELGNEMTPKAVYFKAFKLRNIIFNNEEPDMKTEISDVELNTRERARVTKSSAVRRESKPWKDTIMSIFSKRKNEIFIQKSFPPSGTDPIWSSMAADLGNVYEPRTLYNMIARGGKFHNVLFPRDEGLDSKRRLRNRTENGKDSRAAPKKIKKEQLIKKDSNNILSEINEIFTMDSLLKLTETMDTLIREHKENTNMSAKILDDIKYIKKTSKIQNNQIFNEIHSLRNDLTKSKRTA